MFADDLAAFRMTADRGTRPPKADGARDGIAPAAWRQPPAAIKAGAPKHRFQSFWSGGVLTPYESFCLKSFVDRGHAFDLYTFNMDIPVPTGVRIRDAAELFSPEDFFVYEEGFGKGSPSAFSNLFRYKLLVEKGGWWVDTDVVCLAEDIPTFREFFARQDVDHINTAVLFFEPGHPLMVRCLEEAMKMGRTIRWGDTGPHLLTRVVEELGCRDLTQAHSICYPVHYTEAADVLRPSKSASISQRTAASLFIHLWSGMLHHHFGVQKANLPPRDSVLRQWVERHPVDGWRGEYDGETLEHALLLQTELHARAEENRRLTSEIEATLAERERLTAQLSERTAEIERLTAAAEAMLSSRSWQVTGPLRTIGRGLRWLRRLTRQVGLSSKRPEARNTESNLVVSYDDGKKIEKVMSGVMLPRPVSRSKVFGIGLPKTGTTTLGYCLRQFGFTHRSYDMDLAVQVKRNQLENVLAEAEKYEAFEDWPWFSIYKELDQRFPNSKFILTLRKDTETYVESLRKHHARQGIANDDFAKPDWWDDVFGFAPDQWDYQKSALRYERHNLEVQEYFRDRANDLLVVCWERSDGWDELSKFLDRSCPDEPFPHLNISPPI